MKFRKSKDEVMLAEVSTDEATVFVGQETEEEVAPELSKKEKVITAINVVSTLYVIGTIVTMLINNALQYELVIAVWIMLMVYVAVLFVSVLMLINNKNKSTAYIKKVKKMTGWTKSILNLVILAMTVISLVGVSLGEFRLLEFVLALTSLLVALFKMSTKIYIMVLKGTAKRVGKRYKVKVTRFKNGKETKNTPADKIKERMYVEKKDKKKN